MKTKLILYTLAISALVGSLSQNIYTPILQQMQEQLQTSPYLINLSISVFTIALAIMQIVYGPFIDTKGRRAVLLPSLFLYVIASVGCAFSGSISWFLFFRVLQGIGVAAIPVVAATVIGDIFEGSQRAQAMSNYQMLLSLASVIGPLLGGFIGGQSGFTGIFSFLGVTGLIMFIASLVIIPETKPTKGIARTFQLQAYVKVLVHPIGRLVLLLGFAQFYLFYSVLVFLPHVLQNIYGLSAQQTGLAFLPLSLCLMAGSFVSGRLKDKQLGRSEQRLLFTCFLHLIAVVIFTLTANISIGWLLFSLSLYGFSGGYAMPFQSTLLTELFVAERATAIGFYNFIRYVGMAVGPIIGSLLYQDGRFVLTFGVGAIGFAIVILFARKMIRLREKLFFQ
ncbi:MFS transporter [Brevibacillus laterosporus]|uniref:MFS transporter n=1 Tax=Brevibacillus laterosporus TaxID=1465 RepID=UPI000368F953|nr:MFS transporter [Brevibacillus laterosporus]ATO50822.1 MFS transporter [Brevibacillus laterosporus DSM 25]MED2003010.1 MFS transporter [Brevibacillus laterosporus]PPA84563.1 MFS transporter [Brevibacillus laterosporus]